jgi:hypothetical protein
MTYDFFSTFMGQLYGYFGRKPLTPAQETIYWDSLRRYSDATWADTVSRLMRSSRPIQGNFPSPQDLINACQMYQDSEPSQTPEKIPEHFCASCGGRGYLESYNGDDPMRDVSIVRCGNCENWKRRFGKSLPIRTRRQLEDRGRIVSFGPYRREDWDETVKLDKAVLIAAVGGITRQTDPREILAGLRESRRKDPVEAMVQDDMDIPF